ncbi:hypothetical protein A3K48_04830 [candidate division WOR-1 bacterium RIFOXYA12_FULL_52_29]|uniref:Photosynthesis system II assembly factor Ycf48/Hcf136-like domain-containing protein n=1 Tax=candidate division WOR-1 bacterium RIFOXYC12_FULL_54_18 TaxID=1802584 RepID=A0A1F4T6Z1_UNCSA|nr:MAG: hypothetical protein A3K44_04830 [candidate division WOR-1 bacterium RIFOXYA2_FULL_51_19]OGC17872.1 MAG: hypothetical protein A3K48_04830 [candidate division WOR-1 bacterium RIFOXYA12_FULL_52_29]OGC26729.1 MAG: hypothetical protein A3K32_04825 [candidate division WOR-1 bacterium RIFOXYB2_FULL_45_9]OGC28289.1 MAG: hypothetical protein A3K49_04830 [candidate division WOR-1 bacterium RIFOXYC12_FULL_54_18]OGC31253.1 MAG: hypothetical protein A2346_07790 [candidate division WOR-1 bacterium R
MKSKIFITLLISLSVAFAGTSWANWITQESGTTQNINAIHFPSNTVGYAAGGAGTALKSTNGGTTWAVFPGMSASDFNDVFFPSTSAGYFLTTKEAYKSDGATVTEVGSTFAVAANTNFLRGHNYGARISIVGYNLATAPATSYLVTSDDGLAWTTTNITNLIDGASFAVGGVFTTGEGAAIDTWLWGVTSTGSNCAINYNAATATINSVTYFDSAVNDLFFYDRLSGFIALADGTVSRTTTGGTGWNNVDPFPSSVSPLNAIFFITKDFGWVAGDSGVTAYTTDGGSNWGIYDYTPATNIQDIFVRLVYPGELAGVYAYMCGDIGRIYRLRSPTVTALTPSTRYRGWIGTIEVSGTDFMPSYPGGSPLSSAFMKSGETSFDYDVDVRSTTYESASKIVINIFIDPSIEAGTRDLLVTNPDSTATREINALTIINGSGEVTISRVSINGNVYPEALLSETPATTVSPNPRISFDISTILPNSLNASTVRAKVVARYNEGINIVTVIEDIPSSYIRFDDSTVPPLKAYVENFIFNANLPNTDGRPVTLFFYAEDDAGHVGIIRYDLYTEGGGGGTAVEETRAITTPVEIDGGGNFYATVWTKNGNLPDQIQWIIVSGARTGQVIYRKTFSKTGAFGTKKMDVSVRADRARLTAQTQDLRPDRAAQIGMSIFIDPATGKRIAKAPILLIPGSMLQHHIR